MSLPKPRVTPLCKITVDPVSGLHCFPYFDDVGPSVMLWNDEGDVRIVPLPAAGYVDSGVTVGGYTYVVSGVNTQGMGPFRITRWTNAGVASGEFVFGTSLSRQAQLVALKSGRVVCVAYSFTGSVNSQVATRGLDGFWHVRETIYAPNENRPPTLNLCPVQGPDGLIYVLVTQDSNALACLARHNDDEAFSVRDVNPSFLNRNTHNDGSGPKVIDGEMAHGYEMALPTGVADWAGVLFSYQKLWFEMVGTPPQYLAGVSITKVWPDRSKSLFATWPNSSSPDRVERAYPGIPIFPSRDVVTSMQFAFDAAMKRRWLVFETRRSDGVSRLVRTIQQDAGEYMTSSPDGWLFYRPLAGQPFVLERVLAQSPVPVPVPVPVPTPVPVPVPTPVPVPAPRPILVITADKTAYRKGEMINLQFATVAGAELNIVIQPANSKEQGIERRVLIPEGADKVYADSSGYFEAAVMVRNSWKGPITIRGMATKVLSSVEAVISVAIV